MRKTVCGRSVGTPVKKFQWSREPGWWHTKGLNIWDMTYRSPTGIQAGVCREGLKWRATADIGFLPTVYDGLSRGKAMERVENVHGLRRQRHCVRLPHLHALGGNCPNRVFKIKLIPPRLPNFFWTRQDKPEKANRQFGRELPRITIQGVEELRYLVRA